ncbi:ELL-associated factor 1-like [Haliotis asinina]|uniref:ELL-associated factor 1-like n=1 Tax=Haliotis asinina TaxID=109174 RepID=UPI0035319092
MSDRNMPIDNSVHELKLGRSFDPSTRAAFHSIRYDFKPASVDTAREAVFEVGDGHQVSVTVPHVQNSGTSHTVYKGNKKPCPKECVLIIDHDTGTFTLEKLTNTIQLKKTRIEGSSRAQQRPLTPVEVTKQRPTSPSRPKASQRSPSSVKGFSPVSNSQQDMDIVMPDVTEASYIGEISSSSSSSSSSEDSDSDNEAPTQHNPAGQVPASMPSVLPTNQSNSGRQFSLINDLELSESGSDSD